MLLRAHVADDVTHEKRRQQLRESPRVVVLEAALMLALLSEGVLMRVVPRPAPLRVHVTTAPNYAQPFWRHAQSIKTRQKLL